MALEPSIIEKVEKRILRHLWSDAPRFNKTKYVSQVASRGTLAEAETSGVLLLSRCGRPYITHSKECIDCQNLRLASARRTAIESGMNVIAHALWEKLGFEKYAYRHNRDLLGLLEEDMPTIIAPIREELEALDREIEAFDQVAKERQRAQMSKLIIPELDLRIDFHEIESA